MTTLFTTKNRFLLHFLQRITSVFLCFYRSIYTLIAGYSRKQLPFTTFFLPFTSFHCFSFRSVLYSTCKHTTAYTCGIYGWNFDLYDIDGVAITTGYRGMIGERIPSELIQKYESKVKKAIERANFDYKKTKSALDKLIEKFIEELTKEI